MRLFLYYVFCSVKNQIKKLCKTWFIIFLAACMLFGGIIGVGVGLLSESLGEGEFEEEPMPDEGEDVEIGEITEEELAQILTFTEAAVLLLTIVMLFFAVMFGDKSGSSIFLMPDVNLLFSAPMKPQSVLLFRQMNQILLMLFASIYFLVQLPALAIALGLSPFAGLMIFAAWIFMIAYQKLLSVLVYTVASTHERVKKYVRPATLGLAFLLVGLYIIIYINTGDFYTAFTSMLAGKPTRYIPIVGWIKGIVMWSIEGNVLGAFMGFVLLLAFAVGLAYLVWRIKADFYEEAMHKSQQIADAQAAMQGKNTATRDKERSDKTVRDALNRGSGANIFFFKSLYNRKRFSHFGFLTKTSEFYIAAATALALILRLAVKTDSYLPIGIALAALVFFRSLGNPLAADMEKDCFVTIPASAHEKVLWSVLSGSLDCALDLLPAVLAGAVIVGASPVQVLLFYLLALSIDFYASNVMLFIEFSLPSSLALQIKQMITIMFIYFGLVPIAAVIAVGLLLGFVELFLLVASLAALVIGTIFFIFSPIFIEKGRK